MDLNRERRKGSRVTSDLVCHTCNTLLQFLPFLSGIVLVCDFKLGFFKIKALLLLVAREMAGNGSAFYKGKKIRIEHENIN